MIRVLIAEDEPPTMRRIKRMIESSGLPFEVVATALDGEEALRQMRETPVDVVFTDIKMPIMDGLALMDQVREKYPLCFVVILSGYQEFEYATRAIRAKAVDYLLKPVSQADMLAVLSRLQEAQQKQHKQRLTHTLSAAISGMDSAGHVAIPTRAEQKERFHVLLFCAGAMPMTENSEMLPGNALFEGFQLETHFLKSHPGYEGFMWSFMGNSPVEQLFILADLPWDFSEVVEELLGALPGGEIPVSCAYTLESVALPEIGRAIRSLRKTLMANVEIGKALTFPVPMDSAPEERQAEPHDAKQARVIADWLVSGAPPNSPEWVGLIETIRREHWPQRRIYDAFMKALVYAEAKTGIAKDTPHARQLISEVIETSVSLDDLTRGLAGIASLFAGDKDTHVSQDNVAVQVEEYLQEHYCEHINNQTLGAVFGYVPSYISLLFRKEFNASPADRLIQIRLEHAKRLMQSHPDLLMRDIAEKVGFKNPHHFSKTFKRYEGVWPTNYAQ